MSEAICAAVRIDGGLILFALRSAVLDRRSAPLAGLAESDLAGRFRHWHGTSGRRYLFSVFGVRDVEALDYCPRYEEAVMLAVVRAGDGTRRIAFVGETGPLPDLVFDGEALRAAVVAGANEIHMHLLAKDEPSRHALMRDIAG